MGKIEGVRIENFGPLKNIVMGALGCHGCGSFCVTGSIGALGHVGRTGTAAACGTAIAGTAIPGAAAASAAEAAIAVAAGAAAIAPRAALAVGVVGLGIGSSGVDDHTAVTAFPLALAAHTLHLANGRVDDAALVGVHGLHGKAAAGLAHLGTNALCQCGQVAQIGRAHV